MVDQLRQALRGATQGGLPVADALSTRRCVFVIGAGGALGSAVLAEALAAGRFQQVSALVAAPLSSTLRGLRPVTREQWTGGRAPKADIGIVVFDRERRSNGRDDAFEMPDPDQLLPLARLLRDQGTVDLVVLMPHAPALLPQALAQGLASVDEAALAALGFEHLVILRAAQTGEAHSSGAWMQRMALLWLQQLKWMVPARQQPLRPHSLARCVAELAAALPSMPRGTRVVAPETLWEWVQALDARERGAPAPDA